ncbi:MAG: hypothetical protein WCJ29_02040 [bacterium]
MNVAMVLMMCAVAAQEGNVALEPWSDGDIIVLSAESGDPQKVHGSANDFARLVGERLKSEFPRKVVNPNVELRIWKRDGKYVYLLLWSARLIPVRPEQADCYFDRRGTMVSGISLEAADKALKAIEEKEKKLETARADFQTKFGNSSSPTSFTRISYVGSGMEKMAWVIQESFLTAKDVKCKK